MIYPSLSPLPTSLQGGEIRQLADGEGKKMWRINAIIYHHSNDNYFKCIQRFF